MRANNSIYVIFRRSSIYHNLLAFFIAEQSHSLTQNTQKYEQIVKFEKTILTTRKHQSSKFSRFLSIRIDLVLAQN